MAETKMIMDYKESIVGDLLTLEESQYEGEYIAKWRELTVATVPHALTVDLTYSYP